MNRLRQMSIFAHIVESGSISAAAEVLALSKSVVSQHLKSLESELGVTLLKRTTRRQTLTPAGTAFYHKCRLLNDVADEAWNDALTRQLTPQGSIRITAPHALMGTLIAPLIGELIIQYPGIQPELIANDGQLDLMEHEIDLAIRAGQSISSSVRQRRIGEFRDVLCRAPDLTGDGTASGYRYIANHWQGRKIEHQLYDQDTGVTQTLSFIPHCRANSFHACLALLESGAGIGIVPDFIFRQLAAQGKLVEVMPGYQLPSANLYAMHPYQNNLPLVVQSCMQKIEQGLSTARKTVP